MQNNPYDDEIEIDLGELFFELLAHWKLIILSTVLVAAVVGSISFFLITPMYGSNAQLYVVGNEASSILQSLQVGSSLTEDYVVVIKSRPVMDQVITDLGLDMDYRDLQKKVTVEEESERIININVKDEDPNQAKIIVDEIAQVASDYIENKMEQDAPSIILNGYADGKKVSPNNTKNTIIGALLGFVLACAIVIVSFMMNDTIMTNEDVEKKLGINVLGALPLTAGEEEADKIAQKENKKRKKKQTKKKRGEEA